METVSVWRARPGSSQDPRMSCWCVVAPASLLPLSLGVRRWQLGHQILPGDPQTVSVRWGLGLLLGMVHLLTRQYSDMWRALCAGGNSAGVWSSTDRSASIFHVFCKPSLSSKRLSWWRWWGHHHCGATLGMAFLSFPCLGTGIPRMLCLVSAAAPLYPRLRGPVLFSLPLMLNFLSQTSLLGCGKL